MIQSALLKSTLLGGACAVAMIATAQAESFNIPAGDLKAALTAFSKQTGVALIVSGDAINGAKTSGVTGDLPDDAALARILSDTGFVVHRHPSGAIAIVPGQTSETVVPLQMAQAASAPRAVETVTVTSSKLGGADVQSIPIAITALSQEQLTSTQTAGGPDLVKQVPNLTFSKTNFAGYNIQIRGIGTQAISVTTDPAVAVAFNDVPFIRNHFFEQEFFDVSQVEVLRGPQGTLYGRNATAGVVNLISAKPTDHYEAMASVDVGNYNNRRLEGMLNIPIVGDKLDLRLAGEWTKRDGYTFDETINKSVDGRDLWSGRVSVLFHPVEKLSATLVWEHFQEDDNRLRSGKTLCKNDPGPNSVTGPAGTVTNIDISGRAWLSQGCLPGSLYSPDAYGTPNAGSLAFVGAAEYSYQVMKPNIDPYGVEQSHDLRVIGSALEPHYTAKSDTIEFNADYEITPALTLTSQTGYNKDNLYSTEDYNRFTPVSGVFVKASQDLTSTWVGDDGQFCDPQLGCSDTLLGEDVSQEHSDQFSQEIRLSSKFSGPLNFSVGGNFLHYQTVEDYYVFFNAISYLSEWVNAIFGSPRPANAATAAHIPFDTRTNDCGPQPADPASVSGLYGLGCTYVDPNPLNQIDGQGHNYFRSFNPYHLNSWAGFGEVYYQVAPDVKLTGGLRYTADSKRFEDFPSWAFIAGKGYPSIATIDQEWKEVTGRFNATWTPKLAFTDQSMFYASYARGYKGGGANPPGVVLLPAFFPGQNYNSPSNSTHPLTFKPEFVNSYEIGTKNTLLDGSLTLNGSAFYYDYKNYQISQIVDRTSVNLNFDATVKGAEIEATWEPLPGLRFNFAGGVQDSSVNDGQSAIDLMDRTAGHSDWMVVKPFYTQTSNCVLPTSVVGELLSKRSQNGGNNSTPGQFVDEAYLANACLQAYSQNLDPVTFGAYKPDPDSTNYPGYAGFDPLSAPNAGQGFAKDLGGNKLPNTPPFTLSAGAQYSMPISEDWAGTLRGDFYWQGNSFGRVFNDRPYDQIHGYTNVNLTLIMSNQDGWQAMAYVKNVFDTTAITGAFLNSDDTGLTTNVFLTDPRLFGIRITKNW